MKKKKKLIIFSLCIISVFTFIFNVYATIPSTRFGDVDLDNHITIKDASLIQKYLVEITEFNKFQQYCADVNDDGGVTIKDATMIQKKCALIISSFPVPEYARNYVSIKNFNADYNSGKAMAGVPVTFTVSASAAPDPLTFDYYINDKLMIEGTEKCTLTCTFDEVGVYTVKVVAHNGLEVLESASMDYEVVEPYSSESVMVKAFYYDDNERPICPYDENILFTAEPMFGSGVFEYAFYINDELVQDFSDDNKFMVEYFSEEGNYEIKAVISDTVSGEVASETIDVTVEMIAPA